MSKSLKLLLFGVWFACSPPIHSQEPPQSLLKDSIAAGINLKAKPSTGVWMGRFHVVMESTELKSLGIDTNNVLVRQYAVPGAASGNFRWLCFTILDNGATQRIWFTSDDEMGGGTITGILATVLPASTKPTEACPALQSELRPLHLDKGVWIGSTPGELSKVFGSAPLNRQGWSSYMYSGTVTLPEHGKEVEFDVVNALEVDIHRGRVTSIRLHQITSS